MSLFFLSWAVWVLWYFGRRFPLINLLEVLLNGIMLLILLLGFTAIGRRILRLLGITFPFFAGECCFAFGIGSGFTILVIFGLAVVGLLYEVVIVPLILVLFLLAYQDAKTLCIQGYTAASNIISIKKPFIDTFLLVLMGAAGIITFVAAATPPFFFDALVYHLAVPHKYLLLHRFHYIPHQPFSNLPMNLGMLFIVAMSFSGGMLAKLLSWSYIPMTAMAVYAWAKSQWGQRIAITSASIVFLIPGGLIVSTITSIDGAVMFYSFLSFFALLTWCASGKHFWFVAGAMFCSVAIGIKYQAIVVTFFPALLLLLVHVFGNEKRSLFRNARRIIVFGALVLCGMLPWMIKNLLYTGNPLYPFFNALFGSYASYNVDYGELMRRVGNPIHVFVRSLFDGSPLGLIDWVKGVFLLVKVPWSFTMEPSGAAAKIGILFVLCLPGLIFLRHPDKSFKYVLISAAGSLWGWALFLPWIQRYGFPVLPLLSLITAYILWNLPVSDFKRKYVLGIMLLCLLYHLGMFLTEEISIIRPFEYLFGNQPQGMFLVEHDVNHYPVIRYVNHETPPDAKILIVGESRGFYCKRDYLLYTVIEGIDDRELILRNLILESQHIEEMLQKFYDLGITHIVLNASEMKRYTQTYLDRDSYLGLTSPKDVKILNDLFSERYTRERMTQHGVRLYEIRYPASHLQKF